MLKDSAKLQKSFQLQQSFPKKNIICQFFVIFIRLFELFLLILNPNLDYHTKNSV